MEVIKSACIAGFLQNQRCKINFTLKFEYVKIIYCDLMAFKVLPPSGVLILIK